jgi:hypothetical protein
VGRLRGEVGYRENSSDAHGTSVGGVGVVCVIHEDPLRFARRLGARMRGQVV